jgi:acyl dehydratase
MIQGILDGAGSAAMSNRQKRPAALDRPPVRYGEWGPAVRVRLEHSAVWTFARALTDENPIYGSEEAANAAGFSGIPIPPTFSFAWLHSCALPGLQASGLVASMLPPGADLFKTAASPGAVYLHGEQSFTWHRQPKVGDLLEGRMRISEPTEKKGGGGRMVVSHVQTSWTTVDAAPVVTEDTTYILLPGD